MVFRRKLSLPSSCVVHDRSTGRLIGNSPRLSTGVAHRYNSLPSSRNPTPTWTVLYLYSNLGGRGDFSPRSGETRVWVPERLFPVPTSFRSNSPVSLRRISGLCDGHRVGGCCLTGHSGPGRARRTLDCVFMSGKIQSRLHRETWGLGGWSTKATFSTPNPSPSLTGHQPLIVRSRRPNRESEIGRTGMSELSKKDECKISLLCLVLKFFLYVHFIHRTFYHRSQYLFFFHHLPLTPTIPNTKIYRSSPLRRNCSLVTSFQTPSTHSRERERCHMTLLWVLSRAWRSDGGCPGTSLPEDPPNGYLKPDRCPCPYSYRRL